MNNKILIVDDEIMLTELLSAHLSNEGYLVYTSNSTSDAMEKLKIQPDLILLDINIPDIQLEMRLQVYPFWEHIP